MKIVTKLNGIFYKSKQSTITTIYNNYAKLVVPIVTNKSCQINFYWTGPASIFYVYNPTDSPRTNIIDKAYQTAPNGTKKFSIILNSPGTWYVVVEHNIFQF